MVVRGNTVFLRTVREDDLNDLYGRLTDIELRGPYFPISIPSESGFKAQFREDGFWSDTNGIMLICANDDGRILGQIMRFKATPYWDNYEIGYRLLDMSERGHGFTSEALMLFTYILFAGQLCPSAGAEDRARQSGLAPGRREVRLPAGRHRPRSGLHARRPSGHADLLPPAPGRPHHPGRSAGPPIGRSRCLTQTATNSRQ